MKVKTLIKPFTSGKDDEAMQIYAFEKLPMTTTYDNTEIIQWKMIAGAEINNFQIL